MRRLRRAFVLAVCVACGHSYGSDPAPSSPDAGTDAATDDGGRSLDDAGGDAANATDASDAGDAEAPECPTGLGPSMRKLTLISGRAICIDLTEVTSTQYSTFRAALKDTAPYTSKVPPGCASVSVVAVSGADPTPTNLPKVNVSFCSAAFYCAAQGKRLCGSAVDGSTIIVPDGGTSPLTEWELACANAQTADFYPWGSKDPAIAKTVGCIVGDAVPAPTGPRAVGAAPNCGPAGGAGPFDMIGNAWEWVNVRVDQEGVSYSGARGGSYLGATVANGCQTPHGVNGPAGSYAAAAASVGFRCCADAN